MSQKQGILPLWLANKNDYGLIEAGDLVETVGLADVRNAHYLSHLIV